MSSKRTKRNVEALFPQELKDVRDIVDFLKVLRETHQVAQKEICVKTGLSPSTVSRIESELTGLNICGVATLLRAFGYRLQLSYAKLEDGEGKEGDVFSDN